MVGFDEAPAVADEAPQEEQQDPRRRRVAPQGLGAAPQPVSGPSPEAPPAVDPLAFAPPAQTLGAQGLTPPAPAPAQDGVSWFGGPAPSQVLDAPPAAPLDPTQGQFGPGGTGGMPQPPAVAPQPATPQAPSPFATPYTAGSGLNTANPNATATNPFAGYVSPDGGSFGARYGGDAAGARTQFESVSGVTADRIGLPNLTGQDYDRYTRLFGGIASRDPQAIAAGLSDPSPWVREVAQSYSDGRGSAGPTGPVVNAPLAPAATSGSYGTAPTPQQGNTTPDPMAGPVTPSPTPTPTPPPAAPLPPGVGAAGPGAIQQSGLLRPGAAPQPAGASGGVGSAPQPLDLSARQTPTDANNALTNQTLSVGDTADRFRLAQDQWSNFERATNPQYQATLRDTLRAGAAAGGLGSGQLRTSLGNAQNNRELQLDTQRNDLLNNALGGSIDDAYRNVGIAQQQQGFQQGQQQQAFGNEIAGADLNERLTSGSFNRALQQMMQGQSGNPAQTQLALSEIFGNQSSAAGQSLADLIAGMSARNASGGTSGGSSGGGNSFMDMLNQFLSRRQPQASALPLPPGPGVAPPMRP